MADLVGLKDFLGNKKVLVGTGSSDVVLNTFGNVWIKTGNKTVKLTDYIKDVASSSSASEEDTTSSSTNVPTTTSSTYLKKSGDTMDGQLVLNRPFVVKSSQLISNLNAEYISGLSADEIATTRGNDMSVSNKWTFMSPINISNATISSFSTEDGLLSYADGTLTVRCNITDGSESSKIYDMDIDSDSIELNDPVGSYAPFYDIDNTIPLSDVFPDYSYSKYETGTAESITCKNTHIYDSDTISEPIDSFCGVSITYGGVSVSPEHNYSTCGKYITFVESVTIDAPEGFIVYAILKNDGLLATVTVDGESTDFTQVDIQRDGMYYVPFSDTIEGTSFHLYGLYVETDVDFDSDIQLFADTFDPECNDTIVSGDNVVRMYKYIPYYNEYFRVLGKRHDIGDILLFDDGGYAVVTNNTESYSIISSHDYISVPGYVIVGNINTNTIASTIGGVEYEGLTVPVSCLDQAISYAIPVDFETIFCHNDIYYYIYTQNFKRYDNDTKIKGDLIISTDDSSMEVFNSSTRQLVSIGSDGISMFGLPVVMPLKKSVLYQEDGFIKIS